MKFTYADFKLMRLSLAAIVASVLLGGIVIYSSVRYAQLTKKDMLAAQIRMNSARSQLSAAHLDQENMSVFSNQYGALEDKKVIGDDHRLDWIEGLEKLHRQNLVVDFRYNIAPQKTYAPQPAIVKGNFEVHYSEMKLQFDLLHEGQLLNFFTALRTQVNGWYQLEGCTLQRVAENANAGTAAHLKAECSGGWITLKNRNAQP